MMDFVFTSTLISIIGAVIAAVTTFWAISRRQKQHLHEELDRLAKERDSLQQLVLMEFSPQQNGERDYLKELAGVSPSAAIIASWHEVQRALNERRLIGRKDVEHDLEPEIVSLLDELRVLRNKIAHHEAAEVDQSLALKMAELAGRIAQDIRQT